MPGIKNLNDKQFIRAFQVMDRIIQNNQPLFMLVWVGSFLVLLATVIFAFGSLSGFNLVILLIAFTIYLLGVQLPTVVFNIPLNNQLQTLDVEMMNEAELKSARENFEPRWNRWNNTRTILATITSLLLLALLLKL